MSRPVFLPFFLPGSSGNLFSLLLTPSEENSPEHYILFFPPFAEEVNRCRQMISLQAKRFADMGYGVLMVDLFGTGDSEGDFGDATWDIWQRDIGLMHQWLEKQGAKEITLWGLRLGALLAMRALPLFQDKLARILLWQPVVRGDQMMTQFLRLRMAADMIGAGEKVTVRDLRARLADGNSVEVAGYDLTPNLVAGIDGLRLLDLGKKESPPVEWFEVVGSEEQTMSPVNQKVLDAWCGLGMQVNINTVVGESFWTTPEITLVPGLLERTSEIMQEAGFEC